MRIILKLFMKTKYYAHLLMKIVPYIRLSMYYTKLRGWQYHHAYDLLQPGDVLLSVDNKKLTSILIPGTFTHASFCVSKNGKFEVAEMTHSNYTESCLFDIFKEADRVVIMRAQWDEEYKNKVIEKCLSFGNKKYDIFFELGNESLFCSELIYEIDFEKRLNLDLSDLVGLGRKYISPTGIYDCKNLKIVYDSSDTLVRPTL